MFTGIAAFGQSAATQPAGGPELLKDKAILPGYGVESYRLINEPDEIVSVLRNGATVICKRVASPVAAVRGYACTGGVYEGKWLGGGLSHLLEHLVAGGSSERRTEAENRDLLQRIGNDSNAYTTYDHTAYFVNTTTPHFAEAVDLVTGWMLGAKITEPEYRREYQVVQRELERNKGNPDMVFWQLVQSNRYQVSPARVPVIGYQEVIQGLTRDDVYSYYQIAYQPNNMVFAVAADMDPEEMLKTVRQNLADYKPGRAFSRQIASEPPVQAPRTLVATFPDLGQARVELAFPSVKETDEDMYPLDLLAQMLGGGESSVLVEQIRDQDQLCSAISCDDDTPAYVDGSFEIVLQLDAGQVTAATGAILAELEKIKANGVDADRLARAKSQMRIAHLKEMQTSQDVAAAMATDYLSTGDVHFSDQYVQRIEQVTAEQVQRAAEKYLDQGKLLTTILLPREAVGAGGLPKAEDLIRAGATTQPSAVPEETAQITRHVLSNGLVLLHRRLTTTPLVSIQMYALGGVTQETATTNGIGNLAMLAIRRGTATRSADQIADFFDLTTGGDFHTACGNNSWYWTVTCATEDFDKTMEVYSDVVNHPSFDPSQVDQLKARISAAIDGRDAAWDQQGFRYFKRQFFGPKNSPYQFDVLGQKENVAALTAQDAQNYYRQKVLTAPRVLAIFGDIDEATAIATAEKYFGAGPALPPPPPAQAPSLPSATPATQPSINVQRVEIQKTDQEVAAVMIGFDSGSVLGEPSQAGLTVAQCLTGGYGYPTGYIFEILRGRGLVYEAATFNNPGRSADLPGAFIAYAGCDPKNVTEVTNVMLENMARLQGSEQDIQVPWFTRSKLMVTTSEAMQTETPEDQAEQAATDELFGLGYDYHDGFAGRIDAVTLPQVQALAGSRLSNCVVTICTPAPQLVHVTAGVRTYNSFPTVDLTPRGIQHDVAPK
ncbi:MAG: pitrilysin family protein [Tepidisphaeraceae bacterium]